MVIRDKDSMITTQLKILEHATALIAQGDFLQAYLLIEGALANSNERQARNFSQWLEKTKARV